MKRLILCVLALFCCACGCQKEEITPMAAIQQKLTDMEGYSCLATLTIYSNKGETIYETKQDFKSTGEYRMEMLSPDSAKGNYTVFDGKTVCQYNPRLKESVQREVPESQRRNELFLGQFLKNYLQSEGVSVETAAIDESQLASEKLWVDNESLLPVRLSLYDADGKECLRLDYTTFTYNPHFDENLFRIPA